MTKEILEKMHQEVKKLISEVIEVPEEDITEDADLANDLGVDSMMALEIVATIEKKYRVKVPEDKIPVIRTLRNVLDLLEGLLTK
jgi:acyl carrier protein